MIPAELQGVLIAPSETLGGAISFRGTRVHVQALLDALDDGESLDSFLDGYPDVQMDQARAVADWAPNPSQAADQG